MLCEDLFIKIFSFLEWKELLDLCVINKSLKKILEKDRLWRIIFEKEEILKIKSKQDFLKSFLVVLEKEYLAYIINFDYLDKRYSKIYYNSLGKVNWRIPGYVKCISVSMVRVKKMRKFYERNNHNFSSDYKISFNKKIDELLQYSEDYKKDLENETGLYK
jgi:hypothetical protein